MCLNSSNWFLTSLWAFFIYKFTNCWRISNFSRSIFSTTSWFVLNFAFLSYIYKFFIFASTTILFKYSPWIWDERFNLSSIIYFWASNTRSSSWSLPFCHSSSYFLFNFYPSSLLLISSRRSLSNCICLYNTRVIVSFCFYIS